MRPTFDEYVEDRLKDWTSWVLHKNDGGTGFRKYNILYRIMKEGKHVINCTGDNQQYNTENAEEIENLISELSSYNQLQANALRLFYVHNGLIETKAKLLGLSLSSFKSYVALAKAWLKGRLWDNYNDHFGR